MECDISQPRPAQGATETAGAELRVPLPEREPLPHRRPRRRLACSPGPRRLASGRSPSWPSSSAPAPGGGLSGPARLCPSVRTAGWAVSGVAYGAPAAGTPRSIQSATSSVLETPAAHAPEHGPPPASLCGRPDPEQLSWGPLGQRPLFSPSPVPPPEGAWEASGGADGDMPGKQRLVLLRARSTPHAEAGVPQAAAGKPVSPPCRNRQAAVLGGAGPWAWGKGGQRRDGRGAALLGTAHPSTPPAAAGAPREALCAHGELAFPRSETQTAPCGRGSDRGQGSECDRGQGAESSLVHAGTGAPCFQAPPDSEGPRLHAGPAPRPQHGREGPRGRPGGAGLGHGACGSGSWSS